MWQSSLITNIYLQFLKLYTLYSQITTNIERYVSFDFDELSVFNSFIVFKAVHKKTILLQEWEMCSFETFVIKGCVRKYYIDSNGLESILQFAIGNSWISDLSFRIYKKCPKEYVVFGAFSLFILFILFVFLRFNHHFELIPKFFWNSF